MKAPLLTIGIPSLDRGKMALRAVKSILATKFTEDEIQVVLLNNASTRQMEEYDLIADLKDLRLRYYRKNQVQEVMYQFLDLLDLAQGKYLMYMSDEDLLDEDILLDLLPHLNNPYKAISCGFPGEKYCRPFFGYMTNSIFDVTLLKKIKAVDFMKNHTNNYAVFTYPNAVFSFFSDLHSSEKEKFNYNTMPIICFESDIESNKSENRQRLNDPLFHKFYSPEKRLELLRGWLDLFKMFYQKMEENKTYSGSLTDQIRSLYSILVYWVLSGIVLTNKKESDAKIYLSDGLEILKKFIDKLCLEKQLYSEIEYDIRKTHQEFIDTHNLCLEVLEHFKNNVGVSTKILYGCSNYAALWLDRFFKEAGISFDAYFDGRTGLTKKFLTSYRSNLSYPLHPEWLSDFEGEIDVLITAKTAPVVTAILDEILKYNSSCRCTAPFVKNISNII